MRILYAKAVASGLLVGLGVVANTVIDNRYVGSALFSVALLAILSCGLPLYTGRIGFLWETPKRALALMFFGNLAGVIIPLLLYPQIWEMIPVLAEQKFAKSFYELFVQGLFCGVLMFVAVECNQMILTIICIMTFILSGYEHCIAAFPFLLTNLSFLNILKFAAIFLGNSIGAIATRLLIKTSDTGE